MATPGPADPDSATKTAMAPVFIIGAERSGTTWLQRSLLGLSGFAGGQETHFMSFAPSVKFARELRSAARPIGPLCYVDESTLIDACRRLWLTLTLDTLMEARDAHTLIEKTPSHSLYTDELNELFPHCKFIHLVRDGRACAASMVRAYKDGWGRSWAPKSFLKACRRWSRFDMAASKAEQYGSHRYVRIKYEDLRSKPRAINRLASFCSPHIEPTSRMDGLDSEWPTEPDGFNRVAPVDEWQREISSAKRVCAWLLIGKQLKARGYSF